MRGTRAAIARRLSRNNLNQQRNDLTSHWNGDATPVRRALRRADRRCTQQPCGSAATQEKKSSRGENLLVEISIPDLAASRIAQTASNQRAAIRSARRNFHSFAIVETALERRHAHRADHVKCRVCVSGFRLRSADWPSPPSASSPGRRTIRASRASFAPAPPCRGWPREWRRPPSRWRRYRSPA